MKKDSEKEKTTTYFVKLKSLADLARNISTFGDGVRPLFSFKEKGSYRIFTYGIKIGDTRLILFFDSKAGGNFVVYQPGTAAGKEIADVKENMVMQTQNRDLQNIPIIELVKSPFHEDKKAKTKIMNVGIKDYQSIIKGVIARSLENGGIGKVYAFKNKSGTYIGAFNLIEEEDTKVFCYAKVDFAKDYSFFRYNYTTDNVEQTDTFGEHSYLYVRVINLAEPFLFFKPE
ncbi:MAG: hypothetical protein ACHQX1_02245 [Candidatus Micrarchaeales archaeon]